MIQPNKYLIRQFQTMTQNDLRAFISKAILMKRWDLALTYNAHAGYVRPNFFVDYYIKDISYRMLELKDFHIQILSAVKPGEYGKQVNVQAPRGTGKTTLVNRLIPLWRICYKVFDLVMGMQPEEFILIVGRNERMARQRITEIRYVLEHNPRIRRDFGDLVGNPWSRTERDTSNGIALRPLGRGASPRGALLGDVRPTLKLCDDIEDPKRCLNPVLREEDKDWFMTDFMYAGDLGSGHSNTIIVDTVKHPESLSEHLRTVPGWQTLRYQAVRRPDDIYHPTAERLWKQWERIYSDTTLDDDERESKAEAFFQSRKSEMNANVQMLWEEKLPYVRVRKEIVERGYHSVMRELQNDARDPGMALFKMDQAVTFSVADEGFRRSDGRVVPWHDIGGFTTYLNTMGGRDALANSYACAVVVVWEPLPGGGFHEPRLTLRRERIHPAGMARPRRTDPADGARHPPRTARRGDAGACVSEIQFRLRTAPRQRRHHQDVNRQRLPYYERATPLSKQNHVSQTAPKQGRPHRNP